MTTAPQESGSSSIGMKRAVQERGSSTEAQEIGCHSSIKKKLKIKIEEKDKEEAKRHSVECRECGQEVAMREDFLGLSEEDMEPDDIVGFFRNFYNVDREYSADPGPGHDPLFTVFVRCSQCSSLLGTLILRVTVSPEYQPEEHMVVGNYVMNLNWLRLRRGNLLYLLAIVGEALP